MEYLYAIVRALSLGLIVGFLLGGIKMIRKPTYTDKQIETAKAQQKKLAGVAKYLTFLCLGLGFIWCSYFLILGAIDPTQVDYATGMSQLIISILTIVSIAFAFFEFLRR